MSRTLTLAIRLVLIGASAIFAVATAAAAEEAERCYARSGAPAALIGDCTVAIQSGRFRERELARLFNNRGVAYH